MKYRMIVVDLDGTLLNEKGMVSRRTKDAIRLARKAGIVFTFATGRATPGAAYLSEELQLDVPFITYNGAKIVMPGGEVLYHEKMDEQDARQVLQMGKELDTTMCIWSQDLYYGNKLNDRTQHYVKFARMQPTLISSEEELLEAGITKILWYDEVERVTKWRETMDTKILPNTVRMTSQPMFFEHMHRDVSKARAIQKLADHLGIARQEVIAMGDGYNDLEMLTYVGLGVAMGNACEEIQRQAAYVTGRNDEDGVAMLIHQLLEGRLDDR